jgi:hypothetical protein
MIVKMASCKTARQMHCWQQAFLTGLNAVRPASCRYDGEVS